MIGRINFTDAEYKNRMDGGLEVTLRVSREGGFAAREIVREVINRQKQGAPLFTAELSVYRTKRSLNANAYLWALLDKMAAVLHTDKDKVYLMMLERYGVFTHLCVHPQAVERIQSEWRACRELGEVTINGKPAVQLQCYYGSSTYDTAEMARLLDGVVEECRELGIETETPEELARLKAEWTVPCK